MSQQKVSLQVITKKDSEGHTLEPFEEALVEVPEEFVGPVVDLLGSRKGQMADMSTSDQGLTRVTYVMPTRCVDLRRKTSPHRGKKKVP